MTDADAGPIRAGEGSIAMRLSHICDPAAPPDGQFFELLQFPVAIQISPT
jgi:hypothetical protein